MAKLEMAKATGKDGDGHDQKTGKHGDGHGDGVQGLRSHHHGTAERWCAQKSRFGHRTGSSPCAHSIGICRQILSLLYSSSPSETSAPSSPGNYLYSLTLRCRSYIGSFSTKRPQCARSPSSGQGAAPKIS